MSIDYKKELVTDPTSNSKELLQPEAYPERYAFIMGFLYSSC